MAKKAYQLPQRNRPARTADVRSRLREGLHSDLSLAELRSLDFNGGYIWRVGKVDASGESVTPSLEDRQLVKALMHDAILEFEGVQWVYTGTIYDCNARGEFDTDGDYDRF